MTDSIIQLREKLVELSKDPIETRKLLDQLTEEEIDNANIHSHFHVGEKDIEATKDLEFAKVHKTKNGYLLHYHGGYSVLVDEKLMNTCGAIQLLMDGKIDPLPEGLTKEDVDTWNGAVEMVFRLPMFIFSNFESTITIAEIASRYMLLLQKMGEVPAPDTENPEYDKFITGINELLENFAAGLEKEGKEYEERMGIKHNGDGKETQTDESQDKGDSETDTES